jgi:hypothetical protein
MILLGNEHLELVRRKRIEYIRLYTSSNEIYFLSNTIEEKSLPEELLIDKYYWRIIRACIMNHTGSDWIIA